jgi:glycosyltransferase involved in cell wall biosynthesis
MNVVIDYNSNSIVSVGRHTYKKAPYLTILAFQKVLVKHPNLKLVMVGTGEIFEVSKHMVESLGLQEKIILPGGLPREDIIKYLEQSFLFVQHSLVANNGDSEGTPVGIIEAMAAGLPVVSTRHAGIPDVVVEDETGFLVEEGDVDAMAEHILTLVNNRDLAKTFGKKGKAVIQENFTLEKHIDTINKVIANAS